VWKIVLAMCGDFWFNWGMIQCTFQEMKEGFDSGKKVSALLKLNRIWQEKEIKGLEFTNGKGVSFCFEFGTYSVFGSDICFDYYKENDGFLIVKRGVKIN
jgi:hypothetical protein